MAPVPLWITGVGRGSLTFEGLKPITPDFTGWPVRLSAAARLPLHEMLNVIVRSSVQSQCGHVNNIAYLPLTPSHVGEKPP